MYSKIFILIVMVTLVNGVISKHRSYSRLRTDPLSKTRCDLVCNEAEKNSRAICRTKCKSEEVKPGTCPTSIGPRWEAACVEACNTDSHCDGTQRCCRHGCGSSCSEPADLLTLPGLPALPVMGETVEKRKSTIVKWSDGVGDLARAVPGKILYILQEQHHVGPKYEEARLGDWNLLFRTNKTKVSLKNTLKSGRWYRFRVSAVSAAGTRGYSAPSSPFTPRRGPRPPPPPRRLKVRSLKSDNASVSVRLEWREPRSDLPVIRYKVFWSRRVRGLGGELDSVLVNHQTVPKDQTFFDITDLQPNSMYFLQVQTISQYGTGKLRSDKAEIFYNTTVANTKHESESLRRKGHVKNLKLQKILWFNNKIKARITWDNSAKKDQVNRYVVRWRPVKCRDGSHKTKKEMSASTEQNIFEIYELDYNCNYRVTVNKMPGKARSSTEADILVTVPGCEYFQKRMNNGADIKYTCGVLCAVLNCGP